jgi:anaerobic dimethyl sulfoxide reductase subunit B (iron-sulfur subunit)
MGQQYGFYFDAERCINCHACETACKAGNDVEPGVFRRKLIEIWNGEFPDVTRTFYALSCLHCAEPACEKACPVSAITKRPEDGIVIVDRQTCTGCGLCHDACPYGIPQFGADGTMQKCDYCFETGGVPACAEPCPASALYYGTMDELAVLAQEKGGEILAGDTGPSLYIRHSRHYTARPGDLRLA